jgi:hypothetical protein
MTRFVVGDDRSQSTLFPERLEDYLSEDNPVRAIDVFVDELAEIVDQRRMLGPECRFVDLQSLGKILLGLDGLVVVLRDPPHVSQRRSYLRAILAEAFREDSEGLFV